MVKGRWPLQLPSTCANWVLVAVAWLGVCLPVFAIAQTELSAREAVAWALQSSADIGVAQTEMRAAQGRQRSTAGRLDPAWRFNGNVSSSRGEVIPAVVRRQTGNRTLLESLDEEFGEVADQLERELNASPSVASLQCGLGNQILVNGRNVCEDPEVARQRRRLDTLLSTLSSSAGGDPNVQLDFAAIQTELRATNRRFLTQLIETLRLVARNSREAREDLGDVPKNEVISSLMLDFGLFVPFRNGWTLTPQIILESKRDNFEGKPRASRFGGKGLKQTTRSAIGLSVTAPLGRGGRDSVEAEQDAAQLRAIASAQALRFTAQRTSFRVLDAYWRLVAAQRQVDILQRQIEARERLFELASALYKAEEISAAQVVEPKAQLRQAQADRVQAGQARVDANEVLRLAIGRDFSDSRMLLPSSDLPGFSVSCLPNVDLLTTQAARARGDLSSLRYSRDAAVRETARARDAMKPKLDLALTVGYAGREENDAIFQGFERSIFDELAGPSVLLSISGELDLRNRRASGLLTRSLEIAEQAEIRDYEANSQVRREILETRFRVEALAREGLQREQSVAQFRELLSATRYGLQAGEIAPSDALTTELQAFDAETTLLSVHQRFASAVAELGFKSGAFIADSSLTELKPGVERWPWPCP